MIKISATQRQILESADDPGFEARVVAHIRATFGGRAKQLTDDEIVSAHRGVRPRAEAHGFLSGPEIGLFTDYAVIIGAGFDRDPLLPWVQPILSDDSPSRARRLYDGVMAHLDQLVRGHQVFPVLSVRRLRRTPCVVSDTFDPESFGTVEGQELCRELWPQRAGFLDDATWSAFFAAAREEAKLFELSTPAGYALVVALCFVLGIEAGRDPTLPALARSFADRRSKPEAARLRTIREVVRDSIDALLPSAAHREGSK